MRLLRLACRAHRLAAGVARIGSDLLHHPLLAGCPWLLPTPQRFRAAANWLELVRQGVLDGALISGLELEEAEWVNDLRQLLRELGLPLRSGGNNSLQTPDDWIGRIRGTALALVVADGEVESWASLRLGPLPSRPLSPVWLALPGLIGRSTRCCATPPRSWFRMAARGLFRYGKRNPQSPPPQAKRRNLNLRGRPGSQPEPLPPKESGQRSSEPVRRAEVRQRCDTQQVNSMAQRERHPDDGTSHMPPLIPAF
jgi:hypothetical protein